MRFQKHTTNQIIKSSFLNISKSLVKQNIQAEDFPRNGMTGFEIVQGWIKDIIQVARFFFTSFHKDRHLIT